MAAHPEVDLIVVCVRVPAHPDPLPAAPHPFVIEPPPETKRRYAPGEPIEFSLILIGRAIDYLPYFIVAFEELGRHGIGPGNGRYALSEIDGITAGGHSTPIYSGESRRLVSQWPVLHPDDFPLSPDPAPAEATVVFLTPTLVRHTNQSGDLTQFHVLFRNLLRRISLLDYFHCEGEWGPGPRALLEQAEAIETAAHTLRWRQWERYSARQRQRVPMGGWVGRVTYRGDLAPFWPWLLLGQWLHVGKHATFGLGQYRIETPATRLRDHGHSVEGSDVGIIVPATGEERCGV
jgi:hypothetical protein